MRKCCPQRKSRRGWGVHNLHDIPVIYLKDKQVFRREEGVLRLLGNPVDQAKRLKTEGYQLIHIVDLDALEGLSRNMDVYDKLTYFINVQVESAPEEGLVKKLLTFRCRVVLPLPGPDLSGIREKNLLVARGVSRSDSAEDFHDVILEQADAETVKHFQKAGKRVIVKKADFEKLDEKSRALVWGVIFPL
ncbi:hypothetical protein GF318_00085 [Candidatus Micrarchaeota archaeon]|nr:hypothetical protein [Candidatus Micrarchaeota archaeon]